MRCSRYGNVGRMHAIQNGEPLEEVECFKYLGSEVTADGGCERDMVQRMNERYRVWGGLKSVLSNRGHGYKGQEVSICRINCTNGVVRSIGMRYKKC